MRTPKNILAAATALLAAVQVPQQAQAACDRDALLAAAETYKAAQATGSTAELAKLFADGGFAYRQNNKAADITAGILARALRLDHNKTTADTAACASYTELIATGGPYVIGTQIRHAGGGGGSAGASAGAPGAITLVDTVVATTGDWAFDARATLRWVAAEDWGVVPEARRTSRAALQAAGDAYLDMWSNGTAISAVPWGNPCARTEGSMHVTPDCRSGAPSGGGGARNSDRRYVIDETLGSVDILCAFGGRMPDSHEFRLVGGKLVLVHTITV